MKRHIAILTALLLSLSLSLPVFAAVLEHDLSKDNLYIEAGCENEDGYYVYQSEEGDTSNSIYVEDGARAKVTIEDLDVISPDSAIDLEGEAELELSLKGENSLISLEDAGIHVGEGSLRILGDGKLHVESGGDAAAIGSREDEDMEGSIYIGGRAQVEAYAFGSDYYEDAHDRYTSSGDGAGIGSGEYGEMEGSIHITDSARVYAFSNDEGAGIGSGDDASLSGTIRIDGNARVTAISDDEGTGIGSGDESEVEESARILIGGNAYVIAMGDDEGAGIGSADDEAMRGSITIQDNATVFAYGGTNAAAIGSEGSGDMYGTISILGRARVTTGFAESGEILPEEGYAPIGSDNDAWHGYESGEYVIGAGTTINGVSGQDLEQLVELGYVDAYVDANGNILNARVVGEALYHTVYNSDMSICAEEVSVEVSGIKERKLKKTDENYELLTETEGKILKAVQLSFAGDHTGEEFLLSFYVGEELAGHVLEIRHAAGGNVYTNTAVVRDHGWVSIGSCCLGGFTLILN